jgi:ABC-2 type transport system ATP-binding protein
MFVFGTNERTVKTEAKKQLEYWRLEIQGWWNKKIQELSKGMAQKFVVCVLHKPKLLILTNLFWIRPVNANIIKDEILALREEEPL